MLSDSCDPIAFGIDDPARLSCSGSLPAVTLVQLSVPFGQALPCFQAKGKPRSFPNVTDLLHLPYHSTRMRCSTIPLFSPNIAILDWPKTPISINFDVDLGPRVHFLSTGDPTRRCHLFGCMRMHLHAPSNQCSDLSVSPFASLAWGNN